MFSAGTASRLGFCLSGKPTLGLLVELCEENYVALLRIIPALQVMTGFHHSVIAGTQDLHLQILEQTSYTSLVHLTYHITRHPSEPDVVIRAYHDARQAEVMDMCQTALPVASNYFPPALHDKWRANLFLSKWLEYCQSQGHSFLKSNRKKNMR